MKLDQVQQTIDYASFFNASLTLKELHLWLISPQLYSFKTTSSFVSQHPKLTKQLITSNHPSRLKKTRLTNKKISNLQKIISVLKLIPTIKLVALTGSLSVNNPKPNDDIDLMIVTSPHTLWITRPFVILILSLFANRRKPNQSVSNNRVCTNLWLDQTCLVVPKAKQNLYTAHEVLQAKPLFDRGSVYHQFISENSWVKKYLANAYAELTTPGVGVPPQAKPRGLTWLKRILNLLAFKLQYVYMKSKITNEHITPHAAYFHPRNLYPKIIKILQT